MKLICGKLDHVGSISGGGGARAAFRIDEVRIGSKLLEKVRCEPSLFPKLMQGREACLFIYYHFHVWPVILGIKYGDGKFLASRSYISIASRQYAGLSIIAAFVGGFVGQVLGEITGIGTFLGGVGFAAGFADGIWSIFRIRNEYSRIQND